MTGQELINSSLRLIGVIASGETPSTEESNDAFVVMNQLLASWSAQQVPCLGLTRATVTMTGASSYALAVRPLRIKSAMWVVGGVDIEFEVVPSNLFADGRRGRVLFYDGGFTTGTIYLRPAPSTGTLTLETFLPLTAIAALATTINLPPGYERALRFSLALDLCAEFGRPVPESVAAGASESIGAIASLNRQVLGEMPEQQQAEAAA